MNRDPHEIERAREEQRRINAYHHAFNTDDGKLVLEDLRAAFGSDLPVFVPGPAGYDPLHAAIRDGQRQVYIHIKSMLDLPFQGDANVEQPQTEVLT